MRTHRNINQKTWRILAQCAAITYVACWVIGLSTGAPSLALQATGGEITSALQSHQAQASWQFILAEGLAGIMLFLTLWATYRARPTQLQRKLLYIGGNTGILSLIMCGLGLWLILNVVPTGDTSLTKTIYDTINRIDGPKMWLLGAMGVIGFLISRERGLPKWHGYMGTMMAISLGVAGISYGFLIDTLAPAVYVGGILLLCWVLSLGIITKRKGIE